MIFTVDCYISDITANTVASKKDSSKQVTYHNCKLRSYPSDFSYIRCGVKMPVGDVPVGKKVRAFVDITTSWSGETNKQLFTHFNLVNVEVI